MNPALAILALFALLLLTVAVSMLAVIAEEPARANLCPNCKRVTWTGSLCHRCRP